MSLFDHNSNEQKNTQQSTHLGDSQGMPHPIDDAKKLMSEVAGIVRDIRKMVDKASRAMRIMGEP